MTLHSQSLSPDWKTPLILVRGVAQEIGIRLRDAGAVVTPASGSVSLYRDTLATDLYYSGALTPGPTSTRALAAIPATEGLSADWVASWPIVHAGLTYTFRQRAILVGQQISPRISDEDLYTIEPDLRLPARLPAGQTSWQAQISEAWAWIVNSLTARGKQPWLAVDMLDLRGLHLYASLASVCAAIPSPAGGHYADAAPRYRADARRLLLELSIEYEAEPSTHTAAGPSVIPLAPRGRPSW